MGACSLHTKIFRTGIPIIYLAHRIKYAFAIDTGICSAKALVIANNIFIVTVAAKTKVSCAIIAIIGIAH